jgi:Carboxypeptidase regulatory-like domain
MKAKSFLQIPAAIVLIGFISFWACNKTPAKTLTNHGGPNQSPPVVLVTATVTGRVIDANKEPVSGAAITTAFASTTTDVNGQFILTNTQLDQNAAYIVASKTGYFNGSKTFELTAGSSNYVEIDLITKNQSGQFAAGAGGIVTISNGGSINFSANSVVDSATGAAYSGTVTVSAYYLSPSAQNFGDIMPGKLLGISKDSSEKSLESYGMMVAELTSSSGQKLQIASGKTATITFPVPSSLMTTAPAKIPLWYFDDVKGLWREQDSAALQGSNYVANVSHFSFWNCDSPYPLVIFQVLVEDKNNNPLSAVKVGIKIATDSIALVAQGYTDANGNLMAIVPANMNLTLIVNDRCGGLGLSENFTTTSSNINLGTVNANIQSIPVTFAGTLTNCSGTGVTNGDIRIFLDGYFTVANINNGSFSVTVNRCYSTSATAQITAGDLSTNLIDTLSINNVTDVNVESLQLKTCEYSDQFVYYTLKGINDTLSLVNYSFGDLVGFEVYQMVIVATEIGNPAGYFHIYFGDTTVINSPQTDVLMTLTNYDSSYTTNTLTLTEFGSVNNGYVGGTFSGEVVAELNGALVPISGSFRIKRSN